MSSTPRPKQVWTDRTLEAGPSEDTIGAVTVDAETVRAASSANLDGRRVVVTGGGSDI
jgi:hypothetical protein